MEECRRRLVVAGVARYRDHRERNGRLDPADVVRTGQLSDRRLYVLRLRAIGQHRDRDAHRQPKDADGLRPERWPALHRSAAPRSVRMAVPPDHAMQRRRAAASRLRESSRTPWPSGCLRFKSRLRLGGVRGPHLGWIGSPPPVLHVAASHQHRDGQDDDGQDREQQGPAQTNFNHVPYPTRAMARPPMTTADVGVTRFTSPFALW